MSNIGVILWFVIQFCFIALTSFWCNGVYVITSPGKIGFFIRDFIEQHKKVPREGALPDKKYLFPEWIRSPLLSCIYCMPSVHTFIVYGSLTFVLHIKFQIVRYIFIAIPASYLNGVLYKILNPSE